MEREVCVMASTKINNLIISRIEQFGTEDIFVASDFADIADINTIRQVLSRQEQAGKIYRIIRGVYYYPAFSQLLNEYEAPSPHHVAMALARKYGWTIAPSGNTALNQLGLSAQVSSKWSYISDGPYNQFEFGTVELEFKHRSNKDISGLSYKTATVIQALKALGKEHIDDNTISQLQKLLTSEEKTILLQEAKQSTAWVYGFIKKICVKVGEDEKKS